MLIVGIIGMIFLGIILKILKVSFKIIFRLLINSIIGLCILFVFNYFGGKFDVLIEPNFVNSFVVGFLGIPGIVLLMLLK